jgi:hypothetical protein
LLLRRRRLPRARRQSDNDDQWKATRYPSLGPHVISSSEGPAADANVAGEILRPLDSRGSAPFRVPGYFGTGTGKVGIQTPGKP